VEMGSAESVKHKVRASGWESAAEFLWQDIRYGMRQLLRNPGFSAVRAAHTGAGDWRQHRHLHAGACGDAEAVADRASADALPAWARGNITAASGAGWKVHGARSITRFINTCAIPILLFEQIAAFSGNTPSLNVRRANSAAGAQATNGEYVSGNYFSTLGLQPALGRLLNPSDDREGASRPQL